MSQILEKNIKALLKVNPTLASKLFSIKTNDKFEIIQQGDDPINLNIIDKEKKYPIYTTNPLNEIETKRKEFKQYERYPVLYFYGMGNGIFIKLLFANQTHKRVIVIEPNLEILYIALNIVDLSEEIKEKKLIIFLPEELTYAKSLDIFANKNFLLFNKTYTLHIYSKYYEKFYSESIIKINKLFIRAIKQVVNNVGNDTIDNLIGLEHHIKNIPEMINNYHFSQLINKKNSDIAIVVSTGPSLKKQLPLLKEIQNYVTIISVDASLPILEKWDIKPDFVTSLERVEATGEFFKNTSKEFQKDIIMIHASLQHKNVLDNSYGKKFLVMRPFKYTKYYTMHKYGYLGVGMSAANMAYELAYSLGFKTITLIGQDLAYNEDGTSHSEGHIFGKNEVKFKESDEYVTKYGGEGTIRTNRIWNMFRNFFERDIEYTKKENIKTFNCTEGGAMIEGSIEISFKDFIKEYVKKEPKKKLKLRKLSQKTIDKNIQKAYKKTIAMVDYGEKIQKKIEKLFLKVAKECENLEKLKEENKLDKINYNKLYNLSNQIDKLKEIIESKKFSTIFGETVESYLVNKELDLAKIVVSPSNTEIEKKAKLIDWIMNHKEWLFMLAGSINAQNIVVKRALKDVNFFNISNK